MTVVVVIAAGLLVLLAMARTGTPAPRRGLVYWWTWSNFGLMLLYFELVAAQLISDTDVVLGIVSAVPAMVMSLVMFARAVVQRGTIALGALLCLAPVVVSLGYLAGDASVTTPLTWICIVVGTVVLPPGGYDRSEVMAGLVDSLRTAAAALVVLAVALPGTLVGECRIDKCSVWGGQIGSAGSANALGMALAFLCVAVAVGLSWWRASLLIICAVVLTDLSSSRSAFTVIAVGAAALLVERCSRGRARAILRGMVAASVSAAVVAIAILPTTPAAFTLRGSLWLQARQLIQERPVLGWGVSYWVRQPETATLTPNYAVHNVLLEMLVSFGAVGVVALIAGLFVLRSSIPASALGLWYVLVFAWLAGGVTEVIAAPGRLYLLPGAFLVMFVLSTGKRVDATRRSVRAPGRARVQTGALPAR